MAKRVYLKLVEFCEGCQIPFRWWWSPNTHLATKFDGLYEDVPKGFGGARLVGRWFRMSQIGWTFVEWVVFSVTNAFGDSRLGGGAIVTIQIGQ